MVETGAGIWHRPVFGTRPKLSFWKAHGSICFWRWCWSRLGCVSTIPLRNFSQSFRVIGAKPLKLWYKRWSKYCLLKQCFSTSNNTAGVIRWDSPGNRHSAAIRVHPSAYSNEHITTFGQSLVSACYSITKSKNIEVAILCHVVNKIVSQGQNRPSNSVLALIKKQSLKLRTSLAFFSFSAGSIDSTFCSESVRCILCIENDFVPNFSRVLRCLVLIKGYN